MQADAVRTLRKYWLGQLPEDRFRQLLTKVLANDAIEQVIVGPLNFDRLEFGSAYQFKLVTRAAARDGRSGTRPTEPRRAALSFAGRDADDPSAFPRNWAATPPTPSWKRSPKPGASIAATRRSPGESPIDGPEGDHDFDNMLKETIFAATQEIRKSRRDAGFDDWCVSVFEDNAGIVRFDDQYDVAFKVETHNHPSALEPYGGANTGLGGVIRDTLGTGMAAKPVCNTDVFCFAPPDTSPDALPPGVLHPRRVMKGVVSGVRDYGNRMGIPDRERRDLFRPALSGQSARLLRQRRPDSARQDAARLRSRAIGSWPSAGEPAATASTARPSARPNSRATAKRSPAAPCRSATPSPKKCCSMSCWPPATADFTRAITDCGAGGFSSAVGEMGEKIGAEVWLDRAPLKYQGLSYTEIWISEAQERMVLAVPPDKLAELSALCTSEGVEATVIGEFAPTGRLKLKYGDAVVADLSMEFLHGGRPPVVREAVYAPRNRPPSVRLTIPVQKRRRDGPRRPHFARSSARSTFAARNG